MATDVFDEHRFTSQTSLYEPPRTRLTKTITSHAIAGSTSTITRPRHLKYATQSSASITTTSSAATTSTQQRNSGSNDLISLFRTFAMKPFRTASMTSPILEGQTSNLTHTKPPVSLLKYRPLSENVTDHTSYAQATRQIEGFLKRMGWPVNSTTDEARVKWKIAMKFLIPVKFDVNRAINLYRTHETIRKNENLDRIWIHNPHLIREIHSNKFFSLPPLPNQPLTVYFTASQVTTPTLNSPLSQHDRELIALQALICQLDVATESVDVQQNGINFIYDMQTCSASHFDMNLSKKILKLLQGGYPAMVKNIYIISAPKWFKIAYKVSMQSPDQIRDILTNQYNYPLENIPVSLGGLSDPTMDGHNRYQTCFSTVTNSQSICYPYYSVDYQVNTTKSSSNILFFNPDHHHHNNQNQDASPTSPTSLVAIVALRRSNPESSRTRKRESSSSSDSEKRRRSNGSIIEEEPSGINSLTYIPHEIPFDQSQQKPTSLINENSFRLLAGGEQEKINQDARNSMSENENINRRETKRASIANSLYKPLTAAEFLAKSNVEIKQEYRKLPNPPAKDTQAAREERNLDKSRYRDVIPGEATRVKLLPDGDEKHDFINANYVSGHNQQERAYIFAQGPLESTVKDFWRMVWQENIVIIVMTTNIREKGMIKCYPYWPLESKETLTAGIYQIQNEKSERFDSFTVNILTLRKRNSAEQRTIYHAHYLKWPDHGIPSNTKDALEFLDRVDYYRQITMTKAPILLHCSAGIGRTGTFCAIDIGIKRYLERKTIDIPSTVMKMRTERAGSVQTEDQYVFAYLALKDFIEQQLTQERESTNADLVERYDETKDTIGLSEIDDNVRKTSRTKKHGKKSNELRQTNTLPSINSVKNSNVQVSPAQRGKTLSDSSVSTAQPPTPSSTIPTPQIDSHRQRTSAEYSSSMPTTTGNVHHKKARK